MPRSLGELATMIAKRDHLTLEEAQENIKRTIEVMEYSFMNGNLDSAEEILKTYLNLEPDYLPLFIN